MNQGGKEILETTDNPPLTRDDMYNAGIESLRRSCLLILWSLPDAAIKEASTHIIEIFRFYTERTEGQK